MGESVGDLVVGEEDAVKLEVKDEPLDGAYEVSYSCFPYSVLLHSFSCTQAPEPIAPLDRNVKEEVSDEPPLCVKSEPAGTTSPPPSPPRLPGRAKRAKLVVRFRSR